MPKASVYREQTEDGNYFCKNKKYGCDFSMKIKLLNKEPMASIWNHERICKFKSRESLFATILYRWRTDDNDERARGLVFARLVHYALLAR